MKTVILSSKAFKNESVIPSRYTCDGEDISPALDWHDVPENTASFVLICDDPDAPGGNWDHWLLFNLPGSYRTLPEGFLLSQNRKEGIRGGTNDFRRLDYGGPCPPGGVHRYFFKIYALDVILDLPEGSRKNEIEAAMKGHILGQGQLMGKYSRAR